MGEIYLETWKAYIAHGKTLHLLLETQFLEVGLL